MKTVTLFRHAKSGQRNDPNIADIDRALSARGLKTAPKMGMAIRNHKIRPNLVLSSPSVRTRQTLKLVEAEAWDEPPKIRFYKRLYEASAATMLNLLKKLPEDVAHVMIVGHNPGLQELAIILASPDKQGKAELEAKFPSAALASFTFDADTWKELEPATGKLRLFITPNSLAA
jgi:phosphohistidine phosphatase